jgi:hypothetical protein
MFLGADESFERREVRSKRLALEKGQEGRCHDIVLRQRLHRHAKVGYSKLNILTLNIFSLSPRLFSDYQGQFKSQQGGFR